LCCWRLAQPQTHPSKHSKQQEEDSCTLALFSLLPCQRDYRQVQPQPSSTEEQATGLAARGTQKSLSFIHSSFCSQSRLLRECLRRSSTAQHSTAHRTNERTNQHLCSPQSDLGVNRYVLLSHPAVCFVAAAAACKTAARRNHNHHSCE